MNKRLLIILGVVIAGIIVVIAFCSHRPEKAEEPPQSEPPAANLPEGFSLIGDWYDRISERATMTIKKGDGESAYDVEISWSESADETSVWTFSGTFDHETGFLYYQDCRKAKVTGGEEAATGEETVEYEGGTGSLSYYDEALIWQDDEEDAGGDCRFVKEKD